MLNEFYRDVVAGNIKSIEDMFPGIPAVDTPLSGLLSGGRALRDGLTQEGARLASMKARTSYSKFIRGWGTDACELLVLLECDGQVVELPVVIVGQKVPGGYSHLRVYHSMWPLDGKHGARLPMVWPVGELEEPPIIATYFDALSEGDAGQILHTFSPEGYLREPSGSEYKHKGIQALEGFYNEAFATPGGVQLWHATHTFNGQSFVVEYICERWGEAVFPPTPGCAVYDLSPDSSRIHGVRIYDDISPGTASVPNTLSSGRGHIFGR